MCVAGLSFVIFSGQWSVVKGQCSMVMVNVMIYKS